MRVSNKEVEERIQGEENVTYKEYRQNEKAVLMLGDIECAVES